MKRPMTTKCLFVLGILFSIVLNYPSPASALRLDFTTDESGWINGGFFSVNKMIPCGSGYLKPLFPLQAVGPAVYRVDREGMNPNPDRMLEKRPAWTHVNALMSDHLIDMKGGNSVKCILDTDKPVSKSAHMPEPATLLLFGAGLTGFGLFIRKLNKQ